MITATPQQLRRAADIAEKIEALKEELSEILGGEAPSHSAATGKPGRHKMSAAGRAAIAAAARARWANYRSEKGMGAPVKKRKRRMSAEGRARLVASMKARWAKVKKAGKSRL